jgi:Mg2+ and Co2+ transporter CorA
MSELIDYGTERFARETLGTNVPELVETEVVHRPSQRIIVNILKVKRQVSALRRHVAPLREVVNSLETSTHGIVKRENRPYVRDVKGKVQSLYERLEAQRSLLESLEDEAEAVLVTFHPVAASNRLTSGLIQLNIAYMKYSPVATPSTLDW